MDGKVVMGNRKEAYRGTRTTFDAIAGKYASLSCVYKSTR